MRPTFKEEKKLWRKGYQYVVGMDEVGRGAFAGPVVVSAVIFQKDFKPKNNLDKILLEEVNDSKLLNPSKRKILAKIIKKRCLSFSLAKSPVSFINKFGVGKATKSAFRKVIRKIQSKLKTNEFYVLVDGFHIPYLKGIGLKKQKAIIKGDRKSISIASSSIIAKVHRDKLMENLQQKYPGYGFLKNKGYGTKEHRKAIKKHGLSGIHRKSFKIQVYE